MQPGIEDIASSSESMHGERLGGRVDASTTTAIVIERGIGVLAIICLFHSIRRLLFLDESLAGIPLADLLFNPIAWAFILPTLWLATYFVVRVWQIWIRNNQTFMHATSKRSIGMTILGVVATSPFLFLTVYDYYLVIWKQVYFGSNLAITVLDIGVMLSYPAYFILLLLERLSARGCEMMKNGDEE